MTPLPHQQPTPEIEAPHLLPGALVLMKLTFVLDFRGAGSLSLLLAPET